MLFVLVFTYAYTGAYIRHLSVSLKPVKIQSITRDCSSKAFGLFRFWGFGGVWFFPGNNVPTITKSSNHATEKKEVMKSSKLYQYDSLTLHGSLTLHDLLFL